MGLIEDARRGVVTEEMRIVAAAEGVTEDFVRRGVAEGHIVIPVSPYRKGKDLRHRRRLRTKVNASIGTSSDIVDVDMRVEKPGRPSVPVPIR
jgi:phosphomethylpyrimidine synthase